MRAALTGRVKRYAERRGLLPNQGELLLCGVSGGADSMCMLSLMSELARMRKFEVAAAHFNHGLRGESSERDAHFVRDYCDAHGVRLETGARTGAAPFGASESESREARYAFFSSAAEKLGAIAVATAHNADDNAETLLLQLARGSGSLPGIAPERVFKSGLRVVRPMLCATRGEIDAYLAARAVPHVEDESNADSRYARNRVRLEVMPALRAVNA
ncbi:MAG: tRNA lysidine(34) synthetase TilS, partial [Oscillospiraceae bacterium]|nr:tRNA lysidine(34) synthetase TilS [Oscillospiraceae bacterium]